MHFIVLGAGAIGCYVGGRLTAIFGVLTEWIPNSGH
jgi:ketopantoate reductase